MTTARALLASASLAVLLTGCLTVSQYKFVFDFASGEVTREYHDLTSRQAPEEKDYSVEKDWATLKRMVEEKKPEFDPDVVEEISKELYAEDNVLSARKLYKVKCPKCFPSRAAILAYLHDENWRFDLINDEIILFLRPGKKVASTNGRKVTTVRNSLIVWSHEARRFEYVVTEPWSGGTSLLPY